MSDSPTQGHLPALGGTEGVELRHVAAAFDPARLTQARVLAELTKAELAAVLGVSPAAVGQYETGATRPRTELLPALARALSVPVAFFAAGRPLGRLDAAGAHFRSLRSTRAKDRAKAVAHAQQLWELTYALEKRVSLPDVDLPEVPSGTEPNEAARALRSAWNIGRGPVPHLAASMEAHGIVVCLLALTDEAVTRVSAYSTQELDRPLVVVTPERATSVYRYRFTCAHELGHLLLHPVPLPGDRQQEREADQFAAEFLTPRQELEPLLPRTVRLPVLDELSRRWGVSVESLLFRMGELGIVSDVSMRRAFQRLAGMAELRREEPLSSYPGEMPTLLKASVDVAAQTGFSRAALARELCWTNQHLAEVLGEVDTRPVLRLLH